MIDKDCIWEGEGRSGGRGEGRITILLVALKVPSLPTPAVITFYFLFQGILKLASSLTITN